MSGDILEYLQQYLPIIIFFGLATAISTIMICIPLVLGKHRPDHEKNSPYECGFTPFSAPRRKFDVKFYLVAILFIIFDIEIMFLFPWAISLGKIGLVGFWSMMVFLAILVVGFVYEWRKGALDW